jgi:hypothetical protein
MAIASFAQEWKLIKSNFEKATNKKKPSEKFASFFNKPSGLTPATAAFDKAVAADNREDAEKALDTLHKAADSYIPTLVKAVTTETDKNVQAEIKVMVGEIDHLVKKADTAVKKVGLLQTCKNISGVPELLKNKWQAALIMDVVKKNYDDDLLAFLLAMAKKDYSQRTYDTFIKKGSENEINIDGPLRGQFDANNLKAGPWAKVTDEMLDLFNNNIIRKVNTALSK